ncbi:MAG TPA: DUF1590 domain-containing protein [Rhodopirellula baltica]|uniref:Uncharacterized protein n=1 Tax=Rhodopirellula baltica (strain DSM 10527 / NCIMB 13988 / SH1) TaxID=243090 RepID=Q7UUP5_RHOBA|nr:hypothetical protein RB3159 [Rhodopirellula baltica SH 1]HBE61707.1 DUF1590 domain-containing protein [Rhodopirellula baltica]
MSRLRFSGFLYDAPLPKRSLGGGRATPFRRTRGRGPSMENGADCPPPEISLNARFPTPPAARAGFSRRYWRCP